MTDDNLIAAGFGVAFIALCGVYVFLRDRFEHATFLAKVETVAKEGPTPFAAVAAKPG